MKTRPQILAGAALAGLLAASASGADPPRPANEIRAIDVSGGPGAAEILIRGTRPPSYTVFKLQDPPRLVVDLAGADVTRVAAPVAVHRGGVRQVTTAQYKDDRSAVGRVIVGLEPSARYEVTPQGDALVVKVASAGAPSAEAAAPATPLTPTPPVERAKPSPPAPAGGEGRGVAGRAVPGPAAPADNVLSRRVDEAKVAHTAHAVTGVSSVGGSVTVRLDGQVARFEVVELVNPPRLALDLAGVSRAPRGPVKLRGAFLQARFGRESDRVRVVLDAAGELPKIEVKRVAGGIAVLPRQPARAEAPRAKPVLAAAPAAAPPAPRDPAAARIAAAPAAEEAPVVITDAAGRRAEPAAAGFAAEAPGLALTGAPQAKAYTGRRITLEFHDIEIRNLLRLIADVSKRNIVVADDVTGRVTVALRNVPWDQALELVLKTKGLDKEELGNVIRVAKFEDIAKEQEARAKAAAARAPLIPLKVRLIPVNFARASDMSARVKDVLSERGTVTVDDRTNVLIVKDVQEALARAEGLVRNLDTEIPQVRIESRIVEASSNFQKQIGVQWGGNASMAPATGNPIPVLFPNVAGATGGVGGGPTTGTAASPNYAVNLPAAVGQGAGGALGFVFGSAGGAFNLNLRISALENSGVVKTISAPSVSTVDNKEATIGQGLSIPFSQVSAAGVNTIFIEAKLELKVTPHVSADGSILMKIKVTNNAPNPQLTGANGQPSISKREAETEALVRDGETTVIGGIYTRQTSARSADVPLLARIPILGFFFRSKTDIDDHTELLIFITPRILNRPATAVATGK
jgi:type IV pilus assembly protein PilQ